MHFVLEIPFTDPKYTKMCGGSVAEWLERRFEIRR